MTDPIAVSQSAREAAEGAFFDCYEEAPNDLWLKAMLAGNHDDDPLVQTIAHAEARGREAGLREAARIAEGWPVNAGGGDYQADGRSFWDAGNVYDQGRLDASQAILALITKETEA